MFEFKKLSKFIYESINDKDYLDKSLVSKEDLIQFLEELKNIYDLDELKIYEEMENQFLDKLIQKIKEAKINE